MYICIPIFVYIQMVCNDTNSHSNVAFKRSPSRRTPLIKTQQAYVGARARACKRARAYTHTPIHIRLPTHAHTHMYTCTCMCIICEVTIGRQRAPNAGHQGAFTCSHQSHNTD